MKTLKFTPALCDKILTGEKTSTWRLFDDKDIQTGDELFFVNKVTEKIFGKARVTALVEKTLDTLEEKDWVGHEQYDSVEEMYTTYRSYYGEKVGSDSEVKIIAFAFQPT